MKQPQQNPNDRLEAEVLHKLALAIEATARKKTKWVIRSEEKTK